MLDTLIESRARRPRAGRRGGAAASTLVHAALIGGAVAATGRAATTRRGDPAPPPLLYVAAPAPPPAATPHAPSPRPRRAPGTPDAVRTTPPAAPRAPAPFVPPQLSLPTVDAAVALGRPDDFARSGLRGAALGNSTGADRSGAGLGEDAPLDAATVDRAAAPRPDNPAPRYPEGLRVAAVEGRVLVRFVVDTAGRVEPGSLRVVTADDARFEGAVRAVLPRMRFTPAAPAYGFSGSGDPLGGTTWARA